MNRMLVYLSMDGSRYLEKLWKACDFNTPYWQPDNKETYINGALAMSATQRFITPECHLGVMPYQHNDSGCVINADVYLTNREYLCKLLEMDLHNSDSVLILHAYLKWGEECTQYLAGHFSFVIWDPKYQHLYVVVDQFAHSPLFYLYKPGKVFISANDYSVFPILYQNLTLNLKSFLDFTKDVHSVTETSYQEIQKLPAGYHMIITAKNMRQSRYWNWKSHKRILLYKTCEEYYVELQNYFERAIQVCLRRIGPLTTQISGGLDSSAVTAQAALLLNKERQSLFAFTSVPNGLSGISYRQGWYYHDLDAIDKLISMYHNVQHVIYKSDPNIDIFNKLKPLQHCFDRPLRNINNLDWTLASYEQVLARQGRLLLIGAGGNGTISWSGSSRLELLNKLFNTFKAKILCRSYRWYLNEHQILLSGFLTQPLRASVYPLQLWYGVRRLDPTLDLDLAVFCYNVPQTIYREGKHPLEQRLLTRKGLKKLLPDAISQNPYRGEQGADWYLHYNLHCKSWRKQLLMLPEDAQTILWKAYDRQKIMSLFDKYTFINSPPNHEMSRDLCNYLLRCISMGLYLQSRFDD